MHIVTKVEPIQGGRGRARIYLDGAFAFVLYKKECKEYHIEEDATLSDDDYTEITEVLLPKRAKMRAMHLLEARPYTEQGLRDKLTDGEYPAEAIEEAIAYVKSYHYLDDLQYAVDHITYHLADRNRRRLTQDLMKKGVDRHVIDEAFAQVCQAEGMEETEDLRAYETEMIRRELQKKHFDAEQATYEEKARLLASLSRKGYDPDAVRDAMR